MSLQHTPPTNRDDISTLETHTSAAQDFLRCDGVLEYLLTAIDIPKGYWPDVVKNAEDIYARINGKLDPLIQTAQTFSASGAKDEATMLTQLTRAKALLATPEHVREFLLIGDNVQNHLLYAYHKCKELVAKQNSVRKYDPEFVAKMTDAEFKEHFGGAGLLLSIKCMPFSMNMTPEESSQFHRRLKEHPELGPLLEKLLVINNSETSQRPSFSDLEIHIMLDTLGYDTMEAQFQERELPSEFDYCNTKPKASLLDTIDAKIRDHKANLRNPKLRIDKYCKKTAAHIDYGEEALRIYNNPEIEEILIARKKIEQDNAPTVKAANRAAQQDVGGVLALTAFAMSDGRGDPYVVLRKLVKRELFAQETKEEPRYRQN